MPSVAGPCTAGMCLHDARVLTQRIHVVHTVCLSALCVSVSFLQVIGEFVAGQSLWAVLAIFCGLVLVGTTFISHTVGAMVILPIVQSVGDHMPGNHSKLLVMGAALMCSGGWRLGSGFRVLGQSLNPRAGRHASAQVALPRFALQLLAAL